MEALTNWVALSSGTGANGVTQVPGALLDLLRDPGLASAMGRRGRRAAERFSIEQHVEGLLVRLLVRARGDGALGALGGLFRVHAGRRRGGLLGGRPRGARAARLGGERAAVEALGVLVDDPGDPADVHRRRDAHGQQCHEHHRQGDQPRAATTTAPPDGDVLLRGAGAGVRGAAHVGS